MTTLRLMVNKALDAVDEATKLQGQELQSHVASSLALIDQTQDAARRLALFSDNEDWQEHSADTIRCLLLPALAGYVQARQQAPVDAADRDNQRIQFLKKAQEHYRTFLESCLSLGFEFAVEKTLSYYLELKPGRRRDRDAKIAHHRSVQAAETTEAALRQALKQADERSDEDEDTKMQHTLALLHLWILKACDEIEMTSMELHMLEQVLAMRERREPLDRAQPSAEQSSQPQPPLVLTSDMVKHIAQQGKPIDRASFKLLTDGWGRIGRPTMSLDDVYEEETRRMMESQRISEQAAAEKAANEVDPDSDAAADAQTYQDREQDEYNDQHRRGEGNRMNMG